MASLSSKRKAFTNRQLQRRDTSAKKSAKPGKAIAAAVTLTFDENVYADACSRYDLAANEVDSGDTRQLMRAVVQHEFDAGGRENALKMRPYIVKFVADRRARGMSAAQQA